MVLHKVLQVSKNFSHLASSYKMSARFVQEQRRPKLSDHHGSAKIQSDEAESAPALNKNVLKSTRNLKV